MRAVKREHHRWFSPHLQRDMDLLILGHAGARTIVFPTRCGRYFDYEGFGITAGIAEHLERGWLQLYCVESIDDESLYCTWKSTRDRILRHMQYEKYVLFEVLPLSRHKNANPFIITHGCSLGAYHAVNLAFRHPYLFGKVVALSGRYDLTVNIGDFPALLPDLAEKDVYFNTPTRFLPNMSDPRLLEAMKRMQITLAVGEHDPFYENTKNLARVLEQKGIRHQLHVWKGRAHKPYYWKDMARLYL